MSLLPRRFDDRGAVIIIFVLFLTVIMVMAAAVIDNGNLRQEQRQVKTSTDAASLAAVQDVDFDHPTVLALDAVVDTPAATIRCDLVPRKGSLLGNIEQTAVDYLASNEPNATIDPVDGCLFTKTANGGYVTVEAEATVEYTFGKVVGIDEGTTRGSSSAAIGAGAVGGLRPLVLCSGSDEFGTWLAAVDKTKPVKILIDKPSGSCATSGNWGQLDFENGNNSNDTFRGWVEDGYGNAPDEDNTFQVSDGVDPCPMTGQGAECINGDTGADFKPLDSNKNNPENSSILKIKGSTFWLPTTNNVTNPGANAEFEVNGFAEATLTEYCLDKQGTGDCSYEIPDPKNSKKTINPTYFELVIHQWVQTGPCCPQSVSSPPSAARICAIDDDTSDC